MRRLRRQPHESCVLLVPCAHLVELADGDPFLLYDYFLLHHRYLLHLCAPSGRAAAWGVRASTTAGQWDPVGTYRATHSQEAEAQEDKEQLCEETSRREAAGGRHRRRAVSRQAECAGWAHTQAPASDARHAP